LETHSSNNNSSNLFRDVKELTRKIPVKLAVVKNDDGKVLTEGAEIKERWKSYREGLYSSKRWTFLNLKLSGL